ncbi:hypothetical protein ACKKBG_A31650 [Auxenochlorella protothecoides x Auxenochlorella symbiontica]
MHRASALVRTLKTPKGRSAFSGSRGAGVVARSVLPTDMVVQTRQDRREELGFEAVVANLCRAVANAGACQPVSARHAAVLVPLFEDPATRRTHVVLTQRAAGLRSHGGEVCFPGGKREEGDADDVATAVREAQEELGLDPNSVRVLGCLGPVLSKHLLSVTPVLATIPARHAFHPNPDEVQAVFAPPLHTFLEASDLHSSREATFAPGMPYRLHFFDYQAADREWYSVWGLTAAMLIDIASKGFGRDPDFEALPPGYVPMHAGMFDDQTQTG